MNGGASEESPPTPSSSSKASKKLVKEKQGTAATEIRQGGDAPGISEDEDPKAYAGSGGSFVGLLALLAKPSALTVFGVIEILGAAILLVFFLLHPQVAQLGWLLTHASWYAFLLGLRATSGGFTVWAALKRNTVATRLVCILLVWNFVLTWLVAVPLLRCKCRCDKPGTPQCHALAPFLVAARSQRTSKLPGLPVSLPSLLERHRAGEVLSSRKEFPGSRIKVVHSWSNTSNSVERHRDTVVSGRAGRAARLPGRLKLRLDSLPGSLLERDSGSALPPEQSQLNSKLGAVVKYFHVSGPGVDYAPDSQVSCRTLGREYIATKEHEALLRLYMGDLQDGKHSGTRPSSTPVNFLANALMHCKEDIGCDAIKADLRPCFPDTERCDPRVNHGLSKLRVCMYAYPAVSRKKQRSTKTTSWDQQGQSLAFQKNMLAVLGAPQQISEVYGRCWMVMSMLIGTALLLNIASVPMIFVTAMLARQQRKDEKHDQKADGRADSGSDAEFEGPDTFVRRKFQTQCGLTSDMWETEDAPPSPRTSMKYEEDSSSEDLN